MDIPSLLTSPVGALGASIATTLLGELFGAWLAGRKDAPPAPSISVQGRGRVEEIQIGHRWQSEVHHHHHVSEGGATSTTADDSGAEVWLLVFGAVVVGCVAAVAMARYWPVFESAVQILVLVALFTAAILRRRWPAGLAARVGMRLLILAIGAALLWATTTIPVGVAGVPDLAFLNRHTRRLDFGDAVGRAPEILGLQGVFLYLHRLLALTGLIVQLGFLLAKAWGAALLPGNGATSVGRARVWLGEKLTGAIPFGWGAVLLNVFFAAMCITLIHPVSLTWILTLPSTLA